MVAELNQPKLLPYAQVSNTRSDGERVGERGRKHLVVL